MIAIDAVLAHETFENVETLGREDVDTTLLEKVGARVGCVLNEAGVHELLAHRFGHITGHREGRRGRGRNNAGGFSWIRPTIRLRELERCEIPRCVIAVGGEMSGFSTYMRADGIYARRERVVVRPEELLVRRQFQRDDERCE